MYLITTMAGYPVCVTTSDTPDKVIAAWQATDPLGAGEARIGVQGSKDQRLAYQRLALSLTAKTDKKGEKYHEEMIAKIEAENVDESIVKRYLRVTEIEIVE